MKQPKKDGDMLDVGRLHELVTSIRNNKNNHGVQVSALRSIAMLTFKLKNVMQVLQFPDLVNLLVDSISMNNEAQIKFFALTSLAHLAEEKNNQWDMLFVLKLLDSVLGIARNVDEPQNVRDEATQILGNLRSYFVDHPDFHDGDEFYDADQVMRFWRLICAMWIVRSAQEVPRLGKHSPLRRFPQEMSRLLFHTLNDLMGIVDGDGDGEEQLPSRSDGGSDGSGGEFLADHDGPLPDHDG